MSSAAQAGDKPVYAPAPPWVVAAPGPDPSKLEASAPIVLITDLQQRLQDGRVWTYRDVAMRVATPELLTRLGTITESWMPDKGDLIVHNVEILRGNERIDLLATGGAFAVLRREQGLERRSMDGRLTAALAAQGLQVGDVLRVRTSVTGRDPALKGGMQSFADLLTEPARAAFARRRLSWPTTASVQWRSYADGLSMTPKDIAGFRTIEVMLPIAKPLDMPSDMPARFRRVPILEASSFGSWEAVSRTMSPLFATEGLIAAGSPLAVEVAKVAAADGDPLRRAAAALRLVQDQISYLALGMNGGNYVPQAPAETWQLRYGDCKAKTLLLLAMLREMKIEAEPVLVSAGTRDFVNTRLPMPGAFDHVIVRATIGGRSYWLDGTGSATRLADIGDTPPFAVALPLRTAGAGLMPLTMHANARPDMTIATRVDQRAGIDVPELFTTEIGLRGPSAARFQATWSQASEKQRRTMLTQMVRSNNGQSSQVIDGTAVYDPATAMLTITASAVRDPSWQRDAKRMRISLDRAVKDLRFDPDRSRAAWKALPVATSAPHGFDHRMTITLPDDGKGITLEGDSALKTTLAGVEVVRNASLSGDVIRVDQHAYHTGAEIAPADIANERAHLSEARTRELRGVASRDLNPRLRQALAGGKTRYAALETAFAKAIERAVADDPMTTEPYQKRMRFRTLIFDQRGAVEDATRMLALEDTSRSLLARSDLYARLGDKAPALADAKAAFALDPGSDAAIRALALREMDEGDAKSALAHIQALVDRGGKTLAQAVVTQTGIMADAGDATGAIAVIDTALTERPGSPELLNQRCWIKGTRRIALDTALRDCTKAIELADDPAIALDSRAMVYWGMDRAEEALADLDAALEASPNEPHSLYLRGIIRKKTGKVAEGDLDLKGARLIRPSIDAEYARYGLRA